ncbi:hypothetical protein ACFO1B_28015 [Dactylosporangium siamense]|uniref:Uncharacterized protein n=1 Tax=Dactylosporangium siamense TaxID=685454 RepID=A0A919PSS6_9ACTN|nr:hypothetical protein [Dactylosporangium siamense]GIG47780.1 hypothetical protein Dsi01nite_058210 [Dactylosporangium siamense]
MTTLLRPRVVVRFDLVDERRPNRFWLVLDRGGSEVGVQPPGFAEDGVVTTDTVSLIRWYAGERSLGMTQRTGRMTVRVPPMVHPRAEPVGSPQPIAGCCQRPEVVGDVVCGPDRSP